MTLQIFRAFPFKAPWCLELFFPPFSCFFPSHLFLLLFSFYSSFYPYLLILSFSSPPSPPFPTLLLFSFPLLCFIASPLSLLLSSFYTLILPSLFILLSFSIFFSFSIGGLLQEVLWAYASWLWTQESLLTGIWGLYNAVGIELGSTTCNQVF